MSDTLEHELEGIASPVPDPPAQPEPVSASGRPAAGPGDASRGVPYPYNPWITPILDLTAVLPVLTCTIAWAIDPGMGRYALPLITLGVLVAAFRIVAVPAIEARSAVRACEAGWGVAVMSVSGFDPHAPRSRMIAYLDRDDRLAHAQMRYREGRAWLLDDDHRLAR